MENWREMLRGETVLEFALIALVLAAAKGISWLLKRLIRQLMVRSQPDRLTEAAIRILLQLMTPLMMLGAIGAASALFTTFSGLFPIAVLASKIILLWLITRIIWLVAPTRALKIAIASIVLPLIALEMMGWLDPVIDYLDGLAFKIGKVKISAYLALKALVVLSLLLWLTRAVARSGDHAIHAISDLRPNLRELLAKLFLILVYSAAFLIALNILGIDLTALAVVGGALSVGIGFGLQKIAANFISGIILLMENSVKIGDLIELADGTMAIVRKLGARYTLAQAMDGRDILIPNEELITNRLINWTYSNQRARALIMLDLDYNSDPVLARRLMLEAANREREVVSTPAPECILRDCHKEGIRLELTFWVADITQGRLGIRSKVLFAILEAFKASGVRLFRVPSG